MKKRWLSLILGCVMAISMSALPIKAASLTEDAIENQAAVMEATSTDATPGSPNFKGTGWYEIIENVWKYYDNGEAQNKAEGYWLINDTYIYLDKCGNVIIKPEGWYLVLDSYLYIKDGVAMNMPAGWYQIDSKYIYINDDGTRETKEAGWYQIDNKYLYITEAGERTEKAENWYKISNKYLYLKSDGTKVTKAAGWYLISNLWMNLKADGTRVTKAKGWYAINGCWTYLGGAGGHYTSVWRTVGGKYYYFNRYGQFKSGVFKLGSTYYFENQSHGLYKNAVLKTPTTGNWFYYGANGKRVDNALTRLLVKVYRSTVKSGMTTNQKLKAMYMYLATSKKYNKNVVYERRYDDSAYVGKSGWTYNYAYYILSKKKGNCYRFACAFGYMAKMLGYNSYVLVGSCPALRGGLTPHSIVQINIGGKAYYYDPELQFANGGQRFQLRYYSTFHKGKYYKVNL